MTYGRRRNAKFRGHGVEVPPVPSHGLNLACGREEFRREGPPRGLTIGGLQSVDGSAGGGFGGLLTAVRLRQAGIPKIRVVEAGGDVGGTWYWNRYPGAACDIESYIYLPLLEETGYMPVERYSKAEEIRAHCRRIAERFDLYKDLLLSTRVTALDWEAEASRWRVTTDRGDIVRARFVVLSTGPLNRPKLPDIPHAGSALGPVSSPCSATNG